MPIELPPLVLIILDGFGFRAETKANAIALAKAPYFQRLFKDFPHTTLDATGEAVGLPAWTMGNSEVGHLTIGSGRIVYQDLSRINRSIEEGSFFKNPALTKAFQLAVGAGRTVHFMGLLSDAGVHSHLNHLSALLKMVKTHKVPRVSVHGFLDGRDTPPRSGGNYIARLQKELGGPYGIATLIGRYYAMDRDKRWERVKIAYESIVDGKGTPHTDPVAAVQEAYDSNITDEFIQPLVFSKYPRIEDGDVVIFFNFRPDRARELTRSLTDPNFNGFPLARMPRLGMFVCMTQYDKKLPLPVAFAPDKPKRVLAEILSENGIRQFHTAETEKYAHVTYFLNGGVEPPFPGEERLMIPSPRDVATYDQRPEMSALPVTEGVLKHIQDGFPVIIVNFANPDMVGHSGMLGAAIQAVEVIDNCVGRICKEALSRHGTVLITSDHGNCEEMEDEQGGPHTAHTMNPVPFILVGEAWKCKGGITPPLRSGGGLRDITPTILDILGLPKPTEMTGSSLIKR